jgi:hypothetical protein
MIELVGWATHQHYHHRRAPWIKAYTKLLDDPTYRVLSHAARSLLNDLWLLGAETEDGRVQLASKALAWRVREPETGVAAWLAEIAAVKDDTDGPRWVILHGESDLREPLAPCVHDASTPLEQSRVEDIHKSRGTTLPAARAREGHVVTDDEALLAKELPRPEYVTALNNLLTAAQRPGDLAASIRALGPDGAHECVTWEVLGHALMDISAAAGTPTPAAIRAFALRLKAGDPPPRSGGIRLTQREKNMAVLDAALAREAVV